MKKLFYKYKSLDNAKDGVTSTYLDKIVYNNSVLVKQNVRVKFMQKKSRIVFCPNPNYLYSSDSIFRTRVNNMPRKNRSHYYEAMYHVMLRGNYRQSIFNDDEDRLYFYSLLENTIEKFNFKVHVFCLMTNHVHFVIEIKYVPLWKIVQSFASSYAGYSNRKYNRSGHLFQGRYKAKLIQDEKYLLTLCYYIHINPVQAKMVNHINTYAWSSHMSYLGRNHIPWLTINYVNEIIKKYISAENFYRKFIDRDFLDITTNSVCDFDQNGDLTIKDSVNQKIKLGQIKDFSHLKLDTILSVVCKNLDVLSAKILSEDRSRKTVLARSLFAYFAHYYAHYTIKEVSQMLVKETETVSRTMHRNLPMMQKTIS